MSPGISAPIYNCTTDTPAVAPYKIKRTLGGIKMPKQPPAAIDPVASFLSYPAFNIGFKTSNPISVTTAPIIPVAAAKIAQVATVATARAPGTPFIATSKLLKSLSIIPDLSTI